MELLQNTQQALGKPYNDLEFLLNCFAEILVEIEEPNLAAQVPWINPITYFNIEKTDKKLLHLYSISFQLLNLCEVNGAVQNRRNIQQQKGAEKISGLWNEVFYKLKEENFSAQQILDGISKVKAEPVLTAHPTEAKRPVVLALYRKLYLLLVKRENTMYTDIEKHEIKGDIKQILHKLWFIDEIFIEKPEVESELENVLYYFKHVFPTVLPYLDYKFEQALQMQGIISEGETPKLPVVNFGNWVGGDRDGHPFVTHKVTRDALHKFRLEALMLIKKKLDELSDSLSIYTLTDKLNHDFVAKLQELVKLFPEAEKNTREPFKQYVIHLKYKLPIIEKDDGAIELADAPHSYQSSDPLIADLLMLKDCLLNTGAKSLVKNDIQKLVRHLQVFGFHLAHIDIRQNSQFYYNAFMDLIKTGMPCDMQYLTNDQENFKNFVLKEINNNRPFLNHLENLESQNAKEIVQTFQVVSEHIKKYSTRSIGSVIVSMTRSEYDLFLVYLFMREAGVTMFKNSGLIAPLMVVPLFETIEDLMVSPQIMDAYLSNAVTINSLKYIQQQRKYSTPVQEVMIGYSDSNKDGGIFASAWHLHYAQIKLWEVGQKHGVEIRFFHGKGGTISRGAGPTHWFLRSLPENTLNGLIRVTEQGETIERKYANNVNAAYNLELLMAGTAYQAVKNTAFYKTNIPEYHRLFEYLSKHSLEKYKELTHHPSFIKFYEQATPIDAIESSKIGSRPARRSGKRTLSDLRAIPWVFSWTQSRMQLSGWYGVGTTLMQLKQEKNELYQLLKKYVKTSNFVRYVLTNIDTSLAAVDENIIELYSQLVEDKIVRSDIMGLIHAELELTRNNLSELLGRPLADRRKNHYFSTNLRAEALLPLHKAQIAYLKKWRNQENHEVNTTCLNNLLININAIANAMGTTG